MTWSLSASGHHNTPDWEREEYDLLEAAVEAFEQEGIVVSSFSFSGNHVQASSLDEAKAKLKAYEEGGEE